MFNEQNLQQTENKQEDSHSRIKVNKKWFCIYTWLGTEIINESTILFCKLCRDRNGSTQFALGTESLRLDGIKRHLNTHEHKESELQFLNSNHSGSDSEDDMYTLSEASIQSNELLDKEKLLIISLIRNVY